MRGKQAESDNPDEEIDEQEGREDHICLAGKRQLSREAQVHGKGRE